MGGFCHARVVLIFLGPMYFSRELTLPEPWFRYLAPTWFIQATENTIALTATVVPPTLTTSVRIVVNRIILLNSTIDLKKDMRRQAEGVRESAHTAVDPRVAAQAVRDRVLALDAVRDARCVSAFWPVGTELDTRPLMQALADRGVDIGLPVVVAKQRPLLFRRWRPGLAMAPGVHDIPVPPEEAEPVDPDVLIVPLLAFDRQGYRLGYGGGFYDRTLEAKRRAGTVVAAVGYAYAAQEFDAVPHEDFDQPLDVIVTEAETIYPYAAKAEKE